MKNICFPVALLLLFGSGRAQVFKKYPINNSGCSVYMYCNPGKFDEDYSKDSSRVYTAECENLGITYGVYCIKLLDQREDMDMAESLLVSYLDFLKTRFEVQSAKGYAKVRGIGDHENIRGIFDYWVDKNKLKWKIEAWTDGKYIGVLYAKSSKDLPETVNAFLKGFRMPDK